MGRIESDTRRIRARRLAWVTRTLLGGAAVLAFVGSAPASARSGPATAARSSFTCASVNMQSTFRRPSETAFAHADKIKTQHVTGQPGLKHGVGCQVLAEPNPAVCAACSASPLGFYDLLAFNSDHFASAALKFVKQKVFSGTHTSRVRAGDEAFRSPAGGGVRVGKNVFFFRWFPKVPADNSISQTNVLKHVASVLH